MEATPENLVPAPRALTLSADFSLSTNLNHDDILIGCQMVLLCTLLLSAVFLLVNQLEQWPHVNW